MKIEILTIFFGYDFLELFTKTLLPSLWNEGNIPAMLKAGHEVVHRIHCPPKEAECLSLYQVCSDIPVEIDTRLIPQDDPYVPPGQPSPRHDYLAVPFQEQIKRGVLTVMASCDHVFGNGLWTAIQNLKPGEYMVCGHPRISMETGFTKMQQFLKTNHDTDNRKLVKLCMEQIQHPMVEHGKKAREDYWHAHHRPDHWEAHAAEPPPLAFWGTPDMLDPWSQPMLFRAWEVIDHELPGWCFDRNRCRWIDDSRVFFWTEFTSVKDYNPTIYTSLKYGSMKHFRDLPLKWFI